MSSGTSVAPIGERLLTAMPVNLTRLAREQGWRLHGVEHDLAGSGTVTMVWRKGKMFGQVAFTQLEVLKARSWTVLGEIVARRTTETLGLIQPTDDELTGSD